VVVHIDAATLTGTTAGAGVSAEACRRLLCDAGVVPVLEAIVVGMAAALLNDVPGTTLDIDLLVRDTPATRKKLVTFCEALGGAAAEPSPVGDP
jgi:hypothetical protein